MSNNFEIIPVMQRVGFRCGN